MKAALTVVAIVCAGSLAVAALASDPGFVPMCDVDNFAWTVPERLARSAQPPDDAWTCLRGRGFTTVVRQNLEGGDEAERRGATDAGLFYVGDYQLDNDTVYPPDRIGAMLDDVVERMRRGEVVLVHDAGGRGRMGFWEATFLLWDGWSSREAVDRFVSFGVKIDCSKGGNGQMQAIGEIAAAAGQTPYVPTHDVYGTPWLGCARPAYMAGWDYATIRWPAGAGCLWSRAVAERAGALDRIATSCNQ